VTERFKKKGVHMAQPQGLLPVLPLKNTVIFPGLTQAIKVGRSRSIQALKKAELNGYWIVAVLQKQKNKSTNEIERDVEPDDIYSMGTLCRIDSMKGNPENGYHLVLQGFSRVQLSETHLQDGFLETDAVPFENEAALPSATTQALLESLKTLAKSILALVPANTDQLAELLDGVQDLSYLTSLCIGNLDVDLLLKQKILETTDLKDRSLMLLNLMQEFRDGLQLQSDIRGKLNQKMGQAQRQIILREQIKAIREELGEGTEASKEDLLRKKIEDSNMPEEARKTAESELQRLTEVGNQSPESHIIRNYLDLLTALPWGKSAASQEIDLNFSRTTLENDHYGLEKVKKRIIQHLALLKLKKQSKGSILLFVGPPGVGKTSLGQSIAKALGKKFARVSLGGVRDDAEIRGHRRTYIGAMPGRIIQGLKKAGENDPVFLLDEIDKMSRAFHGDPAAALLEVLDPEQNKTFLDHYLDVSFDLSKVFFIATANSLDGIPAPLLDRMEVIDLSGYTTAEKLHIVKNHLIPKQLDELGPEAKVEFSDEALMRLITAYTREAGVRELQRKVAACLRAVSEKVLAADGKVIRIESLDLEELLGSERFSFEVTESQASPGVVTGLAWTPVGGDILFVEASEMPGKGQLMITGQLGDVMKESAHIALSLLRSHIPQLGLQQDLSKIDLHIHVPAGAIPKDGPSAGVSMLTSLASLLLRKPVNPRTAMTGEITLRGAVMPIGGVKEKVIAAHRAGVTMIILPKKNEKDLKEVPEEVRKELQFVLVSNIEELLQASLGLTNIGFFKFDALASSASLGATSESSN
jgi:ATP-dependent Lon protease